MSKFFRMQADWAGVSIERATGSVPDDGRFHVVVSGVIVKSTYSMSAAMKAYREAISATGKEPPPAKTENLTSQDIVRQETDDIEFYRSAIYWSYSRNYAKGGKLQNRR